MNRFNTCLTFWAVVFSVYTSFSQGPGGHLDFNGTSTYVDCGTINLSGSNITLATWARAESFKGSFPYISSLMGIEGSGSTALIRLGDASVPNNIPQFVLNIGGTYYKIEATTALTANKWYHIAGTYDGSTMKLYINGILEGSMAISGAIVANEVFFLGRNYGNDRILDGQMDESSVWLTALSESTIRDWMCKKVTASHPNYADLEAYYQYEDGTGTTVTDFSGNNYTGTISGTATWTVSTAPVGDESSHSYSVPYAANLSGPSFGSFSAVSANSTNVSGIHVYLVNSDPNNTTLPSGVSAAQQGQYWGVFAFGSGTSAVTYSATYNYSGSPLLPQAETCKASMLSREHNASLAWSQISSSNNLSLETLGMNGSGRAEYWLGKSDSFNITASGPLEFCNGDSVVLSLQDLSGLGGATVIWTLDSVPITGATGDSLTVYGSGQYSATVVTSSGCSLQYAPIETANYPGLVELSDFGPLCENGPVVTLSGGSPAPGSYTVNGVASPVFDPSVLGPGMHQVVYTAQHILSGCTGSDTLEVEVKEVTEAGLTFSTSACTNENYSLNQGTPGGGVYLGPGVTGNQFNPNGLNPGLHLISYVYTNGAGCADTATANLLLSAPPTVPVITQSGQKLFSSSNSGNQWYLNGNPINGAIFNPYEPVQSGEYTVEVTAVNGCSSMSEPFAFSALGIGSTNVHGHSVFPNPAKDMVYVIPAKGETVQVLGIYNQLGARFHVETQPTGNGQVQIGLRELPSGIYILEFTAGDKKYLERVVVE